jgi:glycosyltransferase involved in cell wall biosynthesis
MPVFNEGPRLPIVLESVAAQTFDRSRMYLVAVDGNSGDNSRQVLSEWFTKTQMPGCITLNLRRTIPSSLNVGLRYAGEHDIVLRLDAHAVYGPAYIQEAVQALQSAGKDVGCIGAPCLPMPVSAFPARLVYALYTNAMGLGGGRHRFGNDVREVDTAYLGAWFARALIAAGGFDERFEANEDAELCARLRAMGLRILRAPLPCRFIITKGAIASIKQWHKYGYWRAKMLLRHPRFTRLRHVVPPTAAITALAVGFSPLRSALIPAFALYAFSIFRSRTTGEPLAVTLASLLYFPAVQFAFSAGLLRGLIGFCVERIPAMRMPAARA